MKTSRIAMFVAGLALAATPALAHGPGGGGACGADIHALCTKAGVAPGSGNCLSTLCAAVPPGPGGFATCLDSAASKYGYTLSTGCSAQLAQIQAKIAAWQAAFNTACVTTNDVSTFCNNVTTGLRGQSQCLRHAVQENKAVSATCQAFLATHHGHGHHGFAAHGAPGPGCNQ